MAQSMKTETQDNGDRIRKAHLVGTWNKITNAAIVGGKPVCQKMHHEGRVHAKAQQVIYIIQSNLLAKHHITIEVGVVIV